MPWLHSVSYFFGGLFGANSIPHLVSGMMGRPFQSPFAIPPGQGLSSSTVNVIWGAFNLAVAYGLILHVGVFDPRNLGQSAAVGAGAMLISLFAARHFGQFHGGNSTTRG
jgi:hypothetical protein